MKSVKIPVLPKGNEGGNLRVTINIGKLGFSRTEVLKNWEVGDPVYVDNEATSVVFERMSAPKTRVSVTL